MLRRDFLSVSSMAMAVSATGVGSAAPLLAAKSILDYGAKPDGKTLNTKPIQRAIDEAFKAGRRAGLCAARNLPHWWSRTQEQSHPLP